jgi:hypothetical protein
LRSPLLSGANSRTAHLTRPTANSHDGRERHLNFKFTHPGRADGQLIGIMAALFWRTKAAICAAASRNRERRMNSTNQMIACIGGIVLDRKARVEGGARPGTSNPVSVTTSTGGVVANIALLINNARVAAQIAAAFSSLGHHQPRGGKNTQIAVTPHHKSRKLAARRRAGRACA